METVRVFATVHGRVQGVGFRWFVQREAEALDLAGWVRNEVDGTVKVEAEGPPGDVDRLLVALRAGPPGARVDRVDAGKAPPAGYLRPFRIR